MGLVGRNMCQIRVAIGFDGPFAAFAAIVDQIADRNPLDELAGMAKGFFSKK